jgi:purine-binding chemotaxis protein CheW
MTALYVVFKVADAEYVLPAADVLHMESYEGATRVPGAPEYVAGLMQVRRRVIPVVNLRLRFGLPTIEPSLGSRVVVVQAGERAVGLIADSAREVTRIADDDFRPPPELITQQSAGYVIKVAQAGARLLMLVDFHKVIGEEVPHGT